MPLASIDIAMASSGGHWGKTGFVPAGGTMTASGVKYQKGDRAIHGGYTAVQVSTAKLDSAWSADQGYYIPRGGAADTIGKYQGAQAYVANPTKGAVKMPEFSVYKGLVGVTDGRHRFAAVRDSGRRTTWVTVPRNQARYFRKRFGA